MDLFDYSNYESDSFIDSTPTQILGSSGPYDWLVWTNLNPKNVYEKNSKFINLKYNFYELIDKH